MKKIFPFIIILFLLQPVYSQNVKIKFIETSDVHGQLFPYDFINDKQTNHSLAQVYSYVKEERAKEDQHVILLDDGDILQGQPDVYYYNFVRPDTTHILASMMNFMDYDVATVGNHDIEAGHPVYDKLTEEFNFPWLAANAVSDSTGEPYFPPYEIMEVEGIKVAVLGMITPHIPHWLPEKIWYGMHFDDMVECAEKWVKIIKEKENPDFMIGLFHAGVDYTYGNSDKNTYKNENASRLVAERVKGFDIVFVGHDHAGWNEYVTNDFGDSVLIIGTKAGAINIGEAEVDFSFNKETEKWETDISSSLVPTENYKPDEEFMQKFGYAERQTKEYVSKPIGELTETISARDAVFGDAAFTDLINSIQLKLTGADVSFAAPLSFGAGIEKGTLYVRDMFELYKYENLLYTMELTGQEIKDYLEYTSSIWFNEMKDKDDHLLNFVKDKNGNIKYSERNQAPMTKARYYNFDAAEGIDYIIDVSKPEGERITITGFSNGSPFDLSATYKVAINSYRGNGGGGHLIRGAGLTHDELAGRVITSTGRDLRYYMIQWIEKQKVIKPETTHNWKIVPEEWYEAGKEKDYKLIFNTEITE